MDKTLNIELMARRGQGGDFSVLALIVCGVRSSHMSW